MYIPQQQLRLPCPHFVFPVYFNAHAVLPTSVPWLLENPRHDGELRVWNNTDGSRDPEVWFTQGEHSVRIKRDLRTGAQKALGHQPMARELGGSDSEPLRTVTEWIRQPQNRDRGLIDLALPVESGHSIMVIPYTCRVTFWFADVIVVINTCDDYSNDVWVKLRGDSQGANHTHSLKRDSQMALINGAQCYDLRQLAQAARLPLVMRRWNPGHDNPR